jgi:hypothetical protein
MTKKSFLLILTFGLLSAFRLYGQTPVDVVESTLKVSAFGEEVFYYGFAAGDQLVFDFEEVNGKELKELEITELPSSSKFMDYKTKKIENKTISIARTGIYKFRFTNSAIGVRVCKFKIQRVPANASTQNFNTTVFTRPAFDTTYTMDEEEYLSNTDTVFTNFQDRVIKVNGISNATGNKAAFNFVLPENTIAWSYYVGVNPEGVQPYDDAVKKLIPASRSILAKFPLYSPMAAMAMGANSYLTKLQSGEDVSYWIVDGETNVNLFTSGAQFRYIKKGKVFNDYSKMELRRGTLYFCFSNDNPVEPVSVTVKISALQVNEMLATRPVKKMHLAPKNEMYLKN